jgi:hypothetical protein
LEKHRSLAAIEQVLGGLEKAHVVLQAAARRIEVHLVLDGRGS